MVSRTQDRLPLPLGALMSALVFVGGAAQSGPVEGSAAGKIVAGPRQASAPLASSASSSTSASPVATVDLAEIRKRPVFFRGATVQFILQIGSENPTWNPYLTRFDNKRYQSWNAWADSQAIWHYNDYMDSASRFFARRGSKAAIFLTDAAPFERFLVTATVRTIFMGEPWIELHMATPLAHSLGKGSLLHASRAMDFASEDLFRAAADQFKRALAAPLPPAMEKRMRAELKAAVDNIKGTSEQGTSLGGDLPGEPVEQPQRTG